MSVNRVIVSGEHIDEDVNPADYVLIDGTLGWKSALKKDGSKVGLVITAWTIEVLTRAPASAAAAADDE